jgi:preprotein translocase subunit SecA
MSQPEQRAAFAADITYVTGQELGFAYLRDNTAMSPSQLVGKGR